MCVVLTGEHRGRGHVDGGTSGARHDAGDEDAAVDARRRRQPRTAGNLAGAGDEDDKQCGEDKALRRHYFAAFRR